MWTPKRILLMVSGLAVFLLAYTAYAQFLGNINGLPPLPECYKPDDETGPRPPTTAKANAAEQHLQLAFGEGSEEVKRAFRLWVPKMQIAMAAKEFKIVDGNLRLEQFSIAHFGKEPPPGQCPEINTANSTEAIIRFDREIKVLTDISSRKIVFCQLIGNVKLRNNRRTPEQGDDIIVVLQDMGSEPQPLNFDETKHLIWTDARVEITDYQSKPEPTIIEAQGMELDLVTDNNAAKPAQAPPRKQKTETVSGVKTILLKADVHMHLWLDGGSGFLASPKTESEQKSERKDAVTPAAAQPAPSSTAKAQTLIDTRGTFMYDVIKEHAQFDTGPANGTLVSPVVVTRFQPRPEKKKRSILDIVRDPAGDKDLGCANVLQLLEKRCPPPKEDVLTCERLVLQFHRKSTGAQKPANNEDRTSDLEIETADATGKSVVLRSDAENFVAHGIDFHFDAQTRKSVLKGNPYMWASKDGNVIVARELQTSTDQKGLQQVIAPGPGTMDMLDKATGKQSMHAYWSKMLVHERYEKDGKKYDLLTLTGDSGKAFIVDDEQLTFKPEDPVNDEKLMRAKSVMRADTLKILMESADQGNPPPSADAQAESRRQLRRVEGIGRVLVRSPEMYIHDTDYLDIRFEDQPVVATAPPTTLGTAQTEAKETGVPSGPPAASTTEQASATTAPAVPGAPAKPDSTQQNSERPIDLSARSVRVHVSRSGTKNQVEKVWAEKKVLVLQKGATPDDKGVDIRGETLEMTRKPEGNLLVVSGDLAWLMLDKLLIVGAKVNIDQAANKVWVDGPGAMRIDSDATLGGANRDEKKDDKKEDKKIRFKLTDHSLTLLRQAELPIALVNKLTALKDQGTETQEQFSGLAARILSRDELERWKDDIVDASRQGQSSPVTFHWNGKMVFDGREAAFYVDVQVIQDQKVGESDPPFERTIVRVLCQALQVYLDRTVSLKGAEKKSDKSEPPAKVRNLICDKGVRIEEGEWLKGRLTKLQRVEAPVVSMDNEEGTMQTTGPGMLRILQKGTPEPLASSPAPQGKPAPVKPAADELKLTSIKYAQGMQADNQKHFATFRGNVEAVNIPANNPDVAINVDNLPAGGSYLRADQLKVRDRAENGTAGQEMEAHGNPAFVKMRELSGNAPTVTYNEAKDQFIFDGTDNNPANVFKFIREGVPPQEIKARKIIYIHRTNDVKLEGALGVR